MRLYALENRTNKLKLAIVSSLGGKGISIIVQIFALPIAISALGVERFGLYVMLTSLVVWVNIASSAISSALTIKIVTARANNNKLSECELFSSSFIFSIFVAFLTVLIVVCVFKFELLMFFFPKENVDHALELYDGFFWLAFILPMFLLFNLAEAMQAGYQRQVVNNLFIILANLFTVLMLVFFVGSNPTIEYMILSMFLPLALTKGANLLFLFYTESHVIPKIKFFKFNLIKKLLYLGSAFSLMQVGSFLYLNFSIYYVGLKLGASYSAYMSIMFMFISISGSALLIVTQPLVPALRDAHERGDKLWIRNAYSLAIKKAVPYITLLAIIIIFFGKKLMSHWIKTDVDINPFVQILWGSFFWIVAWEHINFSFMIGIDKIWTASVLYFFGSIVMLILCYFLIINIGLLGVFLSICIGPIVSTVFVYPKHINKFLR